MAKLVVVFSGGLDSTVLLASLKSQGHTLHAFSVFYGQRHQKELHNASVISGLLGVPHSVIDISNLKDLFTGSALTTNVAVPHGHYTDAVMAVTVVPNRNMVLLSLALAKSVSIGFDGVAYGAHAGDHAIYSDCRPGFVTSMVEAAKYSSVTGQMLLAPFLHLHKSDIVRLGASLEAPLELSWSCYEGLEFHCGKCATCVERKEAFVLASVVDPTQYV